MVGGANEMICCGDIEKALKTLAFKAFCAFLLRGESKRKQAHF
jgi:hypothetical protein